MVLCAPDLTKIIDHEKDVGSNDQNEQGGGEQPSDHSGLLLDFVNENGQSDESLATRLRRYFWSLGYDY